MAKRRDRQTSAPTASPDRATYDRTGGGTFRVARAQRELAEALPYVVLGRAALDKPRRAVESPQSPRFAQIVKPKHRDTREPLAGLRLDPLEPATCKARPEKTKGNGGSRPFVPWCSRK